MSGAYPLIPRVRSGSAIQECKVSSPAEGDAGCNDQRLLTGVALLSDCHLTFGLCIAMAEIAEVRMSGFAQTAQSSTRAAATMTLIRGAGPPLFAAAPVA